MPRTAMTHVAAVAAVTVLLDQSLKLLARGTGPACAAGSAASTPASAVGPLMLVCARNSGSVLGFGRGLGLWAVLAACGLLLVGWYGRQLWSGGPLARFALGLQVGGASSNLGDRLLLGGVTDVLSLG